MKIRIRNTARDTLQRLAVAACLLAASGVVGVVAWLRIGTGGESASRSTEKNQPAATNQPAQVAPPTAAGPEKPRLPRPARGSVLGRFEVPALKMAWVVLEGTDDRTLDRSIGHIEGTGRFGEAGNIGIAGHRHTHFRKLEWIRLGDEIVLTSKDGAFRYRVDFVRLHKPTDVNVLDPMHGPAVTLVTCFPFEYVGSAPLRLIVRAVAIEETRARLQASPRVGRGPLAGGE